MPLAQTTRHSLELVTVSLLGVAFLAGTAFLVGKLTVPSPESNELGASAVAVSLKVPFASPANLFDELPEEVVPAGELLRERDRYSLHDWVQEHWIGKRMRYRARILHTDLRPRSDNTYNPEIRLEVTGAGAAPDSASFWFAVHGHEIELHVGRGVGHEFRRMAWVGASIDFVELIEAHEVGDVIVLEATIEEAFPTLVILAEVGHSSAMSDTGVSIELLLSNVVLERQSPKEH